MRPEVQHTTDFDRIAALPRRRLTQADADAWAAALTPELRAPASRAELRPWQALSMAECVENDGGWLALPVGVGKTLISYLLPRLMNAKRPLLIVPGRPLIDKTRADFASYVGQWRAPSPPPRVITMQSMAPEGGRDLLDRMRPDLIILDEADEFANRESSAARRIDRYIVDAQDEVKIIAMTGTPSRKTIMGYWHLVQWCLRDRAPMPLKESEALMWAHAIDEKVAKREYFGRRPLPGPLGRDLAAAREWYRNRLQETPGVVIVDGDSCSQPLTVRVRLARECQIIDQHFERFGVKQENPDGIPVSDPLSRWRIDGQLGCGLYMKYDPPPPQPWRDARRAVAEFVRDTIRDSTHTSRPLDTEGQVIRRHADAPEVAGWLEIRDTFIPNTVVVWLSASTIESAVEWLAETPEPGIVWCGGVEFAHALATVTRLPYYGREGRDANGRGLHAAIASRSLIASWHANKRGFNLQAWRRQLIVHPPQSAKYLEQIFGRSHRSGQDRPVVVDVLATSGGTLDGFEAAVSEAGFARRTVGLTQKILRAKIERATPRVNKSNRFRWAVRS